MQCERGCDLQVSRGSLLEDAALPAEHDGGGEAIHKDKAIAESLDSSDRLAMRCVSVRDRALNAE